MGTSSDREATSPATRLEWDGTQFVPTAAIPDVSLPQMPPRRELTPAPAIRRFVAVWIDLWVFLALWVGTAIVLPADSAFYPSLAFFVINTLLTAFWGISLGRALTGIRVVRLADGGAIGLPRALLRVVIVLAAGWLLLFAFIVEYRLGSQPRRMWWDQAAGSRLVLTRRPSTFWNWSVGGLVGAAWGVPLACLLTLENGQGPSVWMLTGFGALLASAVISTYARNTDHLRLAETVNLVATFAVLFLGIGVIVAARPTQAVRHEITIDNVYVNSSRTRGSTYELTATDGALYSLGEGDFHPALPQLDGPTYVGREATLTLDSGTTSVLAISIDGIDHVTATYTNPTLKLMKGWGLGALVLGIGVAMAIVFGHFKWLPRALRRRTV